MRVVGKADLGVMDTSRHMCTGLKAKEESTMVLGRTGEGMIRNKAGTSQNQQAGQRWKISLSHPRSSQVTFTPILEQQGQCQIPVVESLELEGDREIRLNGQVCCSKQHLSLPKQDLGKSSIGFCSSAFASC